MHVSLRFSIAICCTAACLWAGESEPVGTCGDPATIVFAGNTSFSAPALRRAIAGDLPLLLARRRDAPRAAWMHLVGEGVRLGYRRSGFRDAIVAVQADDGHLVVTVREGPRIRCGPLVLPADRRLAELARAALCDPQPKAADAGYEVDTAPVADDPVWKSGAPVDWNEPERLNRRIAAAVRQAGLVGGNIATAITVADGLATLSVIVAEPPLPVRLGAIRVTGIPDGDGERLRRWLALPADEPATRALATAVEQRIRHSAAFVDVEVSWEDEAAALPAALITTIPVDQLGDAAEADRLAMLRKLAERGRADLHIMLRPLAGVPRPWEDMPRSRACVLAAREAMLRRFASGASDLVVATTVAGRSLRLMWSARHGFAVVSEAVQGRGRVLVALADGALAVEIDGRRLRAAVPMPHLTVSMRMNSGEDHDRNPFSLSVNCNQVGERSRLQLQVEPAGLADLILALRKSERPAESWEGPVLVTTLPGSIVRCDPQSGIEASFPRADGPPLAVGLRDGAWDGTVAPLLAGAVESPHDPLGTALGELIAAVRDAVSDPGIQDGLRRAHAVARSGAIDRLVAMLTPRTDDTQSERLVIPMTGERLPRLPAMQLAVAHCAAAGDGMLHDRIAEDAWPRLLLRSVAMAMAGDMRAVPAGLQPLFDRTRAGPIACLVFAHAARMSGNDTLARLLAEAGAERSDAAGLAVEARVFAGLAPSLLPALGAYAEVLAAVEQDSVRAAALRALASTCGGTANPAAQLDAAVRQAAGLGAADWLRRTCKAFAAPATAPAKADF